MDFAEQLEADLCSPCPCGSGKSSYFCRCTEADPPDPWVNYQTEDERPWVDVNGNRHTYKTRKFQTPEKYLKAGCRWSPRDGGQK